MVGKIVNFIQETRQELNKVTWPSRNELWQATVVVMITTFILSGFVGLADFVLSLVMRIILR